MSLRCIEATVRVTLLLTVWAMCVCRMQPANAQVQRSGTLPVATSSMSAMPGQVLDVFVSNKSGALDATLMREDFELLDEGRPASATTFLAPSDAGRRPIVLWVVLQCRMPGMTSDGSGFVRKYTAEIASGLTKLSTGEAYGVAHWCDDGAVKLDLSPNRRIAQLGPTVAGVLAPMVKPPNNALLGEHALLTLVHDTMVATSQYSRDAEPVLLFLYGDRSAASALEVNAILRELIAAPATVFLVNDGLAEPPHSGLGEVRRVIGNLADRTGGGYFHVPFGDTDPFLYAQAIANVIERMHGRYQIFWTPHRADGDEHIVAARLTAPARKVHPGLQLHSRTVYETFKQTATTRQEPAPPNAQTASENAAVASSNAKVAPKD